MRYKNGFTLIELLAVIVILAIIALIATPVILNIIDNTRTSSSEISADMYLSALKNAIVKKNMNEPNQSFNPMQCIIDKEKVTCDGVEIEVEIDKDRPSSGVIVFSGGKIINYYLIIDGKEYSNKKIDYASYGTICTAVNSSQAGSVILGTQYRCKVSEEMVSTSGNEIAQYYNFYVLSISGDKVNLIMSQNLVNNVPFFGKEYMAYEHPLTYSYEGDFNSENSVLNDVETLTSVWTNIPYLNETHQDFGGRYTRILNGRARLPKFTEIRDNGCPTKYENNLDGYYGDCSSWIRGDYWTMDTDTPYMSLWAVNTYFSSLDQFQDGFLDDAFGTETPFGIRPVITVSKTNLG